MKIANAIFLLASLSGAAYAEVSCLIELGWPSLFLLSTVGRLGGVLVLDATMTCAAARHALLY